MLDRDIVKHGISSMIEYIGDDPDRAGVVETPERVLRMHKEIYGGYKQDPADLFKVFEMNMIPDQMIICKQIEFYSMCEHHMLPFFGVAHVAYIPNSKQVIGVSKLARLVDLFAKRLQIQERIGEQVVGALNEHLEIKGAACVIDASHMCMRMRGVNKQQSKMTTSAISGVFEKPEVRQELFSLINL